ncbi:MAG: hypothetical protein ACLVEX_14250 [Ruthenibacterium lactatiformans]
MARRCNGGWTSAAGRCSLPAMWCRFCFFAMMGGIFTSVNPSARETLVPSMTVMGVSMGALIGLPPSLVEIYGSDIKKMYKANGVPLYFGLIPALLSTFLHLMLMSAVIYLTAPPAFGAAAPADPAAYFGALAVFTAASLSVGGVLGVAVRDQAKLTMFSQLFFFPPFFCRVLCSRRSCCPAFLVRRDGYFLRHGAFA